MDRKFTPTALLIVSGLTIFLADFVLIYVSAAVICARGGDVRVFGAPAIATIALSVSVLAGVATLIVARMAWRRARTMQDERKQFTHFQAAALGGLALVAIAWTAAPALLLQTGCS